MSENMRAQWQPSDPDSLARQFARLGWTGFWIQLTLITVPILLLIYVMLFSVPESAQDKGINLGNYLSYGGLMLMLFTTLWFYRYTRLASRIADPELRPSQSSVIKTLWIGMWASCLGIVFSMLLLLRAVVRLLFVLMTMPQTGIPIAAVSGGYCAWTLSAIDAASLTTLLIMLTAEFIVLTFTLWLFFKVTRPSDEIS
jgi:hypothetical protein